MGVITGAPRLRYPVKPHTGICEKCGDSTEVELGTYSVNNNQKTGPVCKDCKEENAHDLERTLQSNSSGTSR